MTTKHASQTPDFLALKQLGLRTNAVACYEALYMLGKQTTAELAGSARLPRTSVYHALEQLERIGFVERQKIAIFHQITRFSAVRLDRALENLAVYQRKAVKKLVDYQLECSIKQRLRLWP